MERWTGLLGIGAALGIVYLLSRDRRAVRWRPVLWGLGLQVALALLLFQVEFIHDGFKWIADRISRFISFGDQGAAYLFGNLAETSLPVVAKDGGGETGWIASIGVVAMLKILPAIVFVASAMSVLYHLGVLQRVVAAMAWVMQRTLRVSGAEALSSAANVFMGMTEAPLLIRPYLPAMTSSELMAVMVGGFATISGSMMAVYHGLFQVDFGFLLAASVLNAPAAIYLTKIYLPESGVPATLGAISVRFERDTVNVIDAAASGAATGLKLALNVGAMLLAFAAGLKLIDALLGWAGSFFLPGDATLSLGLILGWLLAPFAWLLGVPGEEVLDVGRLIGTKIALNEYFAYEQLQGTQLGERARVISTFALCGFANFGSIAIQLGGIGGLAPERRQEMARIGLPAMGLGALASCISAALAGMICVG